MLYPYLSQLLFKQHKPALVFFAGATGKSMAANALATAMRHIPQPPLFLHAVVDLPQAVVTLQSRSLLGSVAAIVRKQPYPTVLAVEAHEAMNNAATAHLLPLASKILVVLCPFTHTGQESRSAIERYVKSELAFVLDRAADTHLVYQADTPHISEVVSDLGFKQQTAVSFDKPSDIQALTIDVLADEAATLDGRWSGVHAKMRMGGSTLPFLAHGGIGRTHVLAGMYAVAAAKWLGVNPIDALQSLRSYLPLPGRMTLIPGVKKTMLVDDTYDADVDSVMHALRDVSALPLTKEHKRFAVLGELSDTGAESEELHAQVGESAAQLGYSMVIAVGEKAADIARGAQRGGLDTNMIFHFADKTEAGKFVQRVIKKGDLALIAGAASQKYETIVKELMAFPLKAKTDLLQR